MKKLLVLLFIISTNLAKSQNEFAVGDTLPSFSFQGQFTKSYTLSQFRGSYILIQFWASWNEESRKMQRNFIEPFIKYKDKRFVNGRRFNIISISIDQNNALWELALKKDNLPWKNNLCEINGWDAILLKQLKVSAIPFNYLLDPNGIIVKVNVNAEKLDEFLRKL